MKADMNAPAGKLSALLDGELDAHDAAQMVRSAVRHAELRADWEAYVLIGDHLRGEAMGRGNLVGRVMDRVREEPVVFTARNVWLPARSHPILALAASIAGVAVVGWLALTGNPLPNQVDVARVTVVPPAIATASASSSPVAVEAPASASGRAPGPITGEMGEYLMAHSAQAAPFRLSDGTPQVRTVSLIGRATHP